MALYTLCSNNSSFSMRFYILALIALVLVCFCSYCSSTLIPPIIDVDPLSDDIHEYDNEDEFHYYVPLRSSPHHYINIPDQTILPSKNHFLNLLLKSNLNQANYQHNEHNNKRYAAQAFHAMRG